MTQENNMDVNEAIQTFYRLKNNYETEYFEKYVKNILQKGEGTWREKRRQLQKTPKPKCINCKRNVGTLFTIKHNDEELNRSFIVKCGDLQNPCPLDIYVLLEEKTVFHNVLEEDKQDINEIKNKIIQAKNDLLFGYKKEDAAFKEFQDLTEELTNKSKLAGITVEDYISKIENPVKEQELIKKETQFGLFIQEYKNMMSEYNKTGNEKLVHSALEFHLSHIPPLAKEIRDMKYTVNMVEFEPSENVYVLLQKKNSIQQLEFSYGSDKVNSFVTGIKNNVKNRTVKMRSENILRKTRKNKPTIELVEEEEQEQAQEEEKEEIVEEKQIGGEKEWKPPYE
jgi:hypothetical protein